MTVLEVNAEEGQLITNNLTTVINKLSLEKIDKISFNSTIKEADNDNYQVNQYPQGSKLSLSAMINNALLSKMEQISINSTSSDQVKEQFITINPEEYNENLIFEQNDEKVKVMTSKVPFILPVPFP